MTQVTRKVLLCALVVWAGLAAGSDSASGRAPATQGTPGQLARPGFPSPAEQLYQQLGSVGLDPARTYRVRGASLDRPALRITLEDGEISFTREVQGRITGAVFEGEGEVLLTPPNRVERASTALFTGMAILEERFASAYFRFNDDTFAEIEPFLREADDAHEFAARWNEMAQNLAELDALRLLLDLSRLLPEAGSAVRETRGAEAFSDRLLHARLQGETLGPFDLTFDRAAPEQIWAGQSKTVGGVTYYDLWTAFALGKAGPPAAEDDAQEDFEIPRYRITTDVRPPTGLSAQAWLQMKVRHDGERTVLFELSRFLKVSDVEVDGKPAQFIHNPSLEGTQLARRGDDQVAVIFPQALRAGQTVELKFVYGGEVLSDAGGGLLYVGARGTWYPNRGMAMADFDLEFHYPPGWTLVATGQSVPVAAPRNPAFPAEQVSHWVSERPQGLCGFNLGKYERVVADTAGLTVETYAALGVEKAFPRSSVVVMVPDIRVPGKATSEVVEQPDPSPARNARSVAQAAVRDLDFYAQRFGPYPYASLRITQIPGRLSQGWPGLVFLSSYAFLNPVEQAELRMEPVQSHLTRLVLPHEIAHQWWGDLVGWRHYRDQWLMEGLANYCALMTIEADNPAAFHKVLDRYRADLLRANPDGVSLRDAGPVTLGQRLTSSHFPSGYEAVSYGRGTWLFHMLREMLRDAEAGDVRGRVQARSGADEPFVRVLRQVRDRYAGKQISADELFAAFEQELPPSLRYEGRKSLDWFVEGWVNGAAVPRFSLDNLKITAGNRATRVSGRILQKDAPDDLVTSVPLYALLGGKPVLLGRVFVDGPETPFHLAAPVGTRKILIDLNETVLATSR
ncbi:MAG TPA: M1 family aminopeptidase [Terriglobales bacterium]|nr:M1 family aminopeptidase [Terriglobales bacterium]